MHLPDVKPNVRADDNPQDVDLAAAQLPLRAWLQYYVTKVTRWLLTGTGAWLVVQQAATVIFHR